MRRRAACRTGATVTLFKAKAAQLGLLEAEPMPGALGEALVLVTHGGVQGLAAVLVESKNVAETENVSCYRVMCLWLDHSVYIEQMMPISRGK